MILSHFKVAVSVALGAVGGYLASEFRNNSPVQAATLIPIGDVIPTKTHRPSEIMRFGFPGTDNLRYLEDYILSYDKRTRTANWVFEHLTPEGLRKNEDVKRELCDFHEDNQVHPYFRSQNKDYKHSGFDRGHLAAAGNHRKSQHHVQETFVLSNMSPQVGKGFNRDSWNRLEMHMRHLTKKYKNVYICTGPLYLPRKETDGKMYVRYQVIGDNHVAVPTHFFKVTVAETDKGELDMESYIMPNAVISDETPLQAFMVPLDTIERASGLLMFDKVAKLRSLNGKSPPKLLHPS